ncbi:MAG: HlyD family efflux transporter periplasmic adaptor subunit [Gammaproteobacteria bacterium]|nr:HlyD family efflux transporter periplasmic adaptor subunit [Gammaproteobacteria bacterium]
MATEIKLVPPGHTGPGDPNNSANSGGSLENSYDKTLTWLISKAVASTSIAQLAFHIVNHTKKVIPYEQAILWQESVNGFKILAVSGISVINHNAPYIRLWEKELLSKFAAEPTNLTFFTIDKFKDTVASYDGEMYQYMISVLFASNNRKGGLVLLASENWKPEEADRIPKVMTYYANIWRLYQNKLSVYRKFKKIHKSRKIFFILLFLALFIPIKDSVLVPAEIAPKKPTVIASSIKGIIKEIYVVPNQTVNTGQPLFKLDTITLENKYDQALKSLDVAKEKYRKGYQQSYNDVQAKTDLRVLSDEIRIAEIELNYSKLLLGRAIVKADSAGTVIFSDPKNWLGRPVEIGERVMLLADENNKQLELFIPIEDLIETPKNANVVFYPNPKPLSTIQANVDYISQYAELQPDEKLAYYAVANFANQLTINERFGIKGTAKIYGNRVLLFYYIFRKPLSWLRRTVGI